MRTRYAMQNYFVAVGDDDIEDHDCHGINQNMGYNTLGRRRSIWSVLVDAASQIQVIYNRPGSSIMCLVGLMTSFVKR